MAVRKRGLVGHHRRWRREVGRYRTGCGGTSHSLGARDVRMKAFNLFEELQLA